MTNVLAKPDPFIDRWPICRRQGHPLLGVGWRVGLEGEAWEDDRLRRSLT